MGCASSVSTTRSSIQNQKSSSMTVFPSTSHGYSSKIKKLDSNVIKQAMIMNLIRTKPRRKSMTNMIQGGYVKTNSMYGRRKPTENDFKFIEQRQMDEVESLHTESTYLSTSEYNGNTGHRGITRVRNGQIKTVIVRPIQENSQAVHEYPFTAVLDYQKKLNQIKEGILPQAEIQKPKPDIEKTVPRGRKPKEESPRMEVVYHVSRDEFCRNIHRIQPSMMNTVVPGAATLNAPPISIVHSKSENPKSGNKKLDRRRDSFISSQDDLSENSFVVTHNTLKVAWEQDLYQQNSNQRLEIPRQSRDSDGLEERKYRNSSLTGSDEIRID